MFCRRVIFRAHTGTGETEGLKITALVTMLPNRVWRHTEGIDGYMGSLKRIGGDAVSGLAYIFRQRAGVAGQKHIMSESRTCYERPGA